MSGVFCEATGARIVLPNRTSSGTVDCRQTICSSCALSRSIWSRSEYFVLALSAA